MRSAHLLNEDLASSEMSFAEPYIKKRRADFSLADVGEGMTENYTAAAVNILLHQIKVHEAITRL